MFGRKKMYKKGLADAMQAYEAFGKKQEGALEKIVQEFKSSNKELDVRFKALGEDIFAVYDYLDKREKEALYKLCAPMDLRELGDQERRLLIAVLCQLADDEGSRYNSDQRKFINAVRRYLEITNVQMTADYSAIEEIDSLDVQETFMRVCLEFLYLQDADEMSDEQEEFFDNFSVNKRQAKLIEFDVIRQFHMFGAEGVAEKYGSGELMSAEKKPQEMPVTQEAVASDDTDENLKFSFLMVIHDVMTVTGRGTVATGEVVQGQLKVGDEVEVHTRAKTMKTVVTGLTSNDPLNAELLDFAEAGDSVSVLLRGVRKDEIQRGDCIFKLETKLETMATQAENTALQRFQQHTLELTLCGIVRQSLSKPMGFKKSEIPPFSDDLLRKLRDSVKTIKDHTLVRRVYQGNWEEMYPKVKYLLE